MAWHGTILYLEKEREEMEYVKYVDVRNQELETLLRQGWKIVGVVGRTNGSYATLVPPVQFETHKMIESGGSVVVYHNDKAPTLEGAAATELSRLGTLGWELVQVLQLNDNRKEFWFRREKRAVEKFVSRAGTDGPTVS